MTESSTKVEHPPSGPRLSAAGETRLKMPQMGDLPAGEVTDARLLRLCECAGQGFLLHWFCQHRTLRDVLTLLSVNFDEPLLHQGRETKSLSLAAAIGRIRGTMEGALAWQGFVETSGLQALARSSLARVTALQAALRAETDPLLRFELERIDAGTHESDRLMLMGGVGATRPRSLPPLNRHGAPFYDMLRALLSFPPVESIAVRGRVDGTVLRLACGEQFRRRERGAEFTISALDMPCSWGVETVFDEDGVLSRGSLAPDWAGAVLWFSEGLQPSALLVDDLAAPTGRTRDLPVFGALFVLLPSGHGVARLPPTFRWHQGRGDFVVGARLEEAEAVDWLERQAEGHALAALST